MSVVCSRAVSACSLSIAGSVAVGLVERGITMIAGLAKGIDTAAHTAALDAGGRTVAVIGTASPGITRPRTRELQDQVTADGLVISQFWPDAPPTKHSFPMRNAVMSGYGRATIVVEASEHSGARIQARQAVAHGRLVILTDLVVKAWRSSRTSLWVPPRLTSCSRPPPRDDSRRHRHTRNGSATDRGRRVLLQHPPWRAWLARFRRSGSR